MEVKIGVSQLTREITVETETSAAEVSDRVAQALEKDQLFSITDVSGRTVLVPPAQIAYVELGSENQRRVGFGAL